jgi:hypothetical protein
MIRLVLSVAIMLAAGAALLMRVDDSEGVVQGFGLFLALFAVLPLLIALVEWWRRRAED